jgi:FkbM family methyltransferase
MVRVSLPQHDPAVSARMTALAQAANLNMEAFFDEVWGWQIGPYRIPDPELPTRTSEDLIKRATIIDKYLRDVNDYWFHVYKPSPGDTIVDIGAGRGEDVFVFSRSVGPTGKVWAIEPHPTSFLALRKLCQWNQLTNVHLRNYACTSDSGLLQIETMPVWESNYVRTGPPSNSSFEVETLRFDDLAKRENIGPISFLKMNIEGAEREALPGCIEALSRTQMACIAAHDFRADRGEGESFRTLSLVKDFLTTQGFELTIRDDPRYYVPYHVHAVRP